MTTSPSLVRYLGSIGLFAAGLAVGLMSPFRPMKDGGTAESGGAGNAGSGHGTDRREDRAGGTPRVGTDAAGKPLPAADSEEFAAAMRAIFKEPIEKQRRIMFDRILERATPEHLAMIVELIRKNDVRDFAKSGEWAQLWSYWGDRDALGALQFTGAKDWNGWGNGVADQAKRPAMLHLASTDPQSAVRYLEQCGDLEKGDRGLVYPLVRGWADQDPEAAAKWAFQSGYAMAGEYRAVVDSLRRNKGDAYADQWFEQMAQGGVPAKDLPGLAKALVAQRIALEPEKAADWVEARAGEPWMGESEAVVDTTRAYETRDPEAAMNWADRTALTGAVTEAFSSWCMKDLNAASAWLDTHPDSPNFQNATVSATEALAAKNPEAAKQMAARILDETSRNNMLQYIEARNAGKGH